MTPMQTDRLSELLKFYKEDPQDAFTVYAIATEYVSRDEDSLAQTWFEQLTKDHPDYVGTYLHYGQLMERQGNPKAAVELYQKGIAVAKAAGDNKNQSELVEALEMLDIE